MATLYKRFIKVCQYWPDSTRCALGGIIRGKVESGFKHGESTHVQDREHCERTLLSLEKITSDYYKQKYPRKSETSYSGLDLTTLTKGMDEMHKNSKYRLKKVQKKKYDIETETK
ncbi:ubiquinol-cytochrome c reductase complex assembly factor 2-like [Ciona intestinalis]